MAYIPHSPRYPEPREIANAIWNERERRDEEAELKKALKEAEEQNKKVIDETWQEIEEEVIEETIMEDLSKKVLAWGKKHKIDNPAMQLVKTMEEFGELCDAIAKVMYPSYYATNEDKARAKAELVDAIGDTLVTLIIESELLGVSRSELTNNTTPLDNDTSNLDKLQLGIMRDLGNIAKQIAHDKKELLLLDASINNAIFAVRSIASAFHLDAKNCLELAYNEIKNRKGETKSGNFIKEQ